MSPSATVSVVGVSVTPGTSSSVTFTASPSRLAPRYSSELPLATAWPTVGVSSAPSSSWAAVTITALAVSQVALVKVSELGLTVRSPPPVMSTVTSAAGSLLSCTV